MARQKDKKRKDGYYEATLKVGETFDGKPIIKHFYSKKSKADALRKGMEKLEQQKAAEAKKTLKTFEEVAIECMLDKKDRVRPASYKYSWENITTKHLIPFFKGTYISQITKEDVERYFRSKKNLAQGTLENHLIILWNIFQSATDIGLIQQNPTQYFKLRHGRSAKIKSVYTPEQAQLVLDYAKQHPKGLSIHIMLSYGTTRSETLGIKYDCIDYEEKTIYIKQSVTQGTSDSPGTKVDEPKNFYRKRKIAVSDETLDMIRNTEQKSDFLFHTRNGLPYSPGTWQDIIFDKFMKDMHEHYLSQGIDVPVLTPHELRHTRATLWVNEGKNLFAIAQQMGWANLEMLRKRYAHSDINSLRGELDL